MKRIIQTIVPLRKLAMLNLVFCTEMIAFNHNANAYRRMLPPVTVSLTFNDTKVVGTITPATPANPDNVANYVNFMIGLAPGGSGDFHGPQNHVQHVTRSTNLFANLPTA